MTSVPVRRTAVSDRHPPGDSDWGVSSNENYRGRARTAMVRNVIITIIHTKLRFHFITSAMEDIITVETVSNAASVTEPGDSLQGEWAGPHLPAFSTVMAVLYLLVCVAGLGGNALVMVTVATMDKMGTAATVYIFNLALADSLFMAGLPFIAARNLQGYWAFGDLACKLVMSLDGVNQFTSVFCLTVMSVDRYMAVADPLRFARWRTPRQAKAISACMWCLSLFPVLPLALHFSAEDGLCSLDTGRASFHTWWPAFLTAAFILGFALPFVVMVSAYAALVAALQARGGEGWSAEDHRAERQVTRMVVAVVLVFAACWLPFYAYNFCSLRGDDPGPAFAAGFEIAVLLSYSWSCANPVLYACLSETFRRHFHTLLCCGRGARSGRRRSNSDSYDLQEDSDGETSDGETSGV
ncbi:somatostatin receptor type 5-like [Megalops cyprinoides]|uniref:somatostatin receptor type 5-like n=1 Tax=Megalops cyprinoides TaxID=118141 RepID=UPI0018646831|nr:somatostatin receptor type 5-like [Megalops cyprinoides]